MSQDSSFNVLNHQGLIVFKYTVDESGEIRSFCMLQVEDKFIRHLEKAWLKI